ncbi:MAG TPA: hypothetical protein PK513_09950 [Alphaproteobacteria bacterium]|nr:hypothetical protein [Alphaproteobacteria bacterium]
MTEIQWQEVSQKINALVEMAAQLSAVFRDADENPYRDVSGVYPETTTQEQYAALDEGTDSRVIEMRKQFEQALALFMKHVSDSGIGEEQLAVLMESTGANDRLDRALQLAGVS